MEKELESLRLLTLPEAAQMLHVSTRTLQRMIRKNDLPAFKVGGQWRVRESQLAQWIRFREGSSGTTENGGDYDSYERPDRLSAQISRSVGFAEESNLGQIPVVV